MFLMPADSPKIAANKPQARSRITNGKALLPSVDGRSLWARLMRDTLSALLVHCGGGDVSETKRLVARRVAVLESELVHMEDSFAKLRAEGAEPEPAAVDLYGRLSDRQRRLAEPLGWERTAREITPTLAEYLAQQTRAGEAPRTNAVPST
jgi:hypothetical protein